MPSPFDTAGMKRSNRVERLQVAQRLKLAVEHDGRPKGDISDAAKLSSHQVLTNMLCGNGGMTHIVAVAKVLKVKPQWLLSGENPPAWMPKDELGKIIADQWGIQKHDRFFEAGRRSELLRRIIWEGLQVVRNQKKMDVADITTAWEWFMAMDDNYQRQYKNGKVSGVLEPINAKFLKSEGEKK